MLTPREDTGCNYSLTATIKTASHVTSVVTTGTPQMMRDRELHASLVGEEGPGSAEDASTDFAPPCCRSNERSGRVSPFIR